MRQRSGLMRVIPTPNSTSAWATAMPRETTSYCWMLCDIVPEFRQGGMSVMIRTSGQAGVSYFACGGKSFKNKYAAATS